MEYRALLNPCVFCTRTKVFYGIIHHDKEGMWADGEFMQTNQVSGINFVSGVSYAITKKGTYKLGTRLPDVVKLTDKVREEITGVKSNESS